MRNTKKKLNIQSKAVKAWFTASNITKYSGVANLGSAKRDKDVAICEFAYKANGWSKPRVLKAMRSVKEYVQVEYFGEKQIVPICQYVCYASNYEMGAIGLHELYKQRSVSKTWIEQEKGHAMDRSTLTYNFWANDILWQQNVLSYKLSVMMRQKKSRNNGHLLIGLLQSLLK